MVNNKLDQKKAIRNAFRLWIDRGSTMSVQDKIIGGILLAHGALGALWAVWIAWAMGPPALFLITNLILAAIGVAAGLGWFKRTRWAPYLGLAFYFVQLPQVLAPTFQWSFTLGFNLNFSLGWMNGGQLGLNMFALAMLLWSSARAFSADNCFDPQPSDEPA